MMAFGTNPQDRRRRAARGAWTVAAAMLAVTSSPLAAQDDYSQAVVQPVPPAALGDLNAAMRDLARDPRDVPALLRAGWASLDLDDTQAALGYFRRAEAAAPAGGEVKAAMAALDLRRGDPVSAARRVAE